MIAFDADDTLWHNETYYLETGASFKQLLAAYVRPEEIERVLGEIEIRNVALYGYGIKSYTLSMLEAAIALTGGRITGKEMRQILELGQEMLRAEVRLFEAAEPTLAELARAYDLMLITKGDLLEQGNKVTRSGLQNYFRHVEIVQDKTAASYRRLLERHGILPAQFIMVGNSLRSDILPVLEIGARAVYIPYQHTWAHERVAESDLLQRNYYELETLAQLPALLARLDDEQDGWFGTVKRK